MRIITRTMISSIELEQDPGRSLIIQINVLPPVSEYSRRLSTFESNKDGMGAWVRTTWVDKKSKTSYGPEGHNCVLTMHTNLLKLYDLVPIYYELGKDIIDILREEIHAYIIATEIPVQPVSKRPINKIKHFTKGDMIQWGYSRLRYLAHQYGLKPDASEISKEQLISYIIDAQETQKAMEATEHK
jgi:hypothetical protein